MDPEVPAVTFPALQVAGYAHCFVERVPGIPVSGDKAEVLAALGQVHAAAVRMLGFEKTHLITAEQVHGGDVAAATADGPRHFTNVDGLLTDTPGLLLGIHVADCAPVFIIDPARRAIALLHSGRKGTEAKITSRAIAEMATRYGSRPEDLIVQIAPCIRPPLFEVDIASLIAADAAAAGVPADQIHDCGVCTGSDTERHYSYRVEKGKTGRMLALLGITP